MSSNELNPIVEQEASTEQVIPVLSLRDVVVYPHMVIPLFVGRDKSIKALDAAMSKDRLVLLVAQRDATIDDPTKNDLFEMGTVASILQLLKLPDGTIKVLVEGSKRAKVNAFTQEDPYLEALTEEVAETYIDPNYDEKEVEVLIRSVMTQFEQYIQLNKKIPPELLTSLASIEEPSRLADTIAAHMTLKIEDKQSLLEEVTVYARFEKLLGLMEAEIDLLQVEKRIRGRVKKQMEKSQREYYLNEQMKAIQKELGELDEIGNETDELERKIKAANMTKEAEEKALTELNRLKMMAPMSAEATVCRNYIDWMLNTPWKKQSKISKDLSRAEQVLDEAHYGLEKVKERILEYLAVQLRVKKLHGPILCLVGPPGVGKTSLGRSIAKATNREFVKMSLGGVRDEAEIRGHRRTYIGAMPGKIIQKLSKVKVKNPLFLLDEIDKMGMDFRGDPASALLEVLDPEQNNVFNDHYLEVDYDLSDVMFVCTANSLNIPAPLMDRLELIRIAGYTEDEKLHIATQHLVPKQIKSNGLKDSEIILPDNSLVDVIRYYTREAGVRSLEREISKISRKVVKKLLDQKKSETITISPESLESYLGVRRFRFGIADKQDRVGLVNGLAWTQVGGELLTIEAVSVRGKGNVSFTGQLGEVMQESIKAAMTVVRSRTDALGIADDFHERYDIHVHVPEGATPKDGPSAGISMCTALVSTLTKIPVHADVAMTGEITLRGEVLPIGGLKEKLLAASAAGIKKVLIPEENRRDLIEIPENVKTQLEIIPVRWIDEVLNIALVHQPNGATATIPAAEPEKSPAAPGSGPSTGNIQPH
jgi:ATP-dependent Lon protease